MGKGAKYAFQKVPMIIRTVFNLALINGYDKQMRIRNKNGEFIPNSNLMDLLNYAMSVGKKLQATNEFIDLLAEADVDPDWIINENVKQMLLTKLKQSAGNSPPPSIPPSTPQSPPPPPTSPQPPLNPVSAGAYWSPEQAKQRKLATYTKPNKPSRPSSLPTPPPLKRRPMSYTPPSSPPSPFAKDNDESQMPTLDRFDVPPSSPPTEMPILKPMKRKHDNEENIFTSEPDSKMARADNNKSAEEPWMIPPPDDDDDDW